MKRDPAFLSQALWHWYGTNWYDADDTTRCGHTVKEQL
jgi:hypothetical protein